MYQYLAAALGIIALVFIVLYATKDTTTIPNQLDEIASNIEECRDRIAAWSNEGGTETSTSTTRANELETILSDCGETLRDSSENLEQ